MSGRKQSRAGYLLCRVQQRGNGQRATLEVFEATADNTAGGPVADLGPIAAVAIAASKGAGLCRAPPPADLTKLTQGEAS